MRIFGKVVAVALSLGALAVAASLTGTTTARGQTGPGPTVVTRNTLIANGVEIVSFSRCVGPHVNALPPITNPTHMEGVVPLGTFTLVCEREATAGLELEAWIQSVVDSGVAASSRDVSLIMYDATGVPVYRFFLKDTYPIDLVYVQGDQPGVLKQVATFTSNDVQRVSPS